MEINYTLIQMICLLKFYEFIHTVGPLSHALGWNSSVVRQHEVILLNFECGPKRYLGDLLENTILVKLHHDYVFENEAEDPVTSNAY